MARAAILGAGFIGDFYAYSINGRRGRDSVGVIWSRSAERAEAFAAKHGIPRWTTSMHDAISDPDVDVVIIGLPNNMHLEAVRIAASEGKNVFCTKPLGRNAAEAFEMLRLVEKAGVIHGYLEDLVYPPKTMKALQAVRSGAIGQVTWTRSRETHPGPHSAWFWTKEVSGGGVLLDMGCHCIEIARNYIGKDIKPAAVMCWADTLVKPIDAEDNALGWVKYENGAIGQFEVSWTFRGGMDLRDEVMGTEGTVWINNFLRTGFEMFSAGGKGGYVAEKAESEKGWLFPVGDEAAELGYIDMFADMFGSLERGVLPAETFYDGYIVNEITDACYRSARSGKWEPVELKVWRGREKTERISIVHDYDDEHILVKEETLPDGRVKKILKNRKTGEISELSL
ncbi:MAG TPA: Gfo/Idh/MocA family oxidoreductase [Bacteroidales bacterium]|jgi:predicted dehydrogenase|nr:Gfo/Idh/MocA family oxidoreductase [Bacteroidales bacterium]HNR42115.1 Gfo/Idh/MocA family oxidoreductase [Bacteroidales bacterium]HQG78363.1 Gfo/Idh/MocA family oxidoreductase [Bacteroidales bacterium]